MCAKRVQARKFRNSRSERSQKVQSRRFRREEFKVLASSSNSKSPSSFRCHSSRATSSSTGEPPVGAVIWKGQTREQPDGRQSDEQLRNASAAATAANATTADATRLDAKPNAGADAVASMEPVPVSSTAAAATTAAALQSTDGQRFSVSTCSR